MKRGENRLLQLFEIMRRCGGTGIRYGLKIRRPLGIEGSNPSIGTTNLIKGFVT